MPALPADAPAWAVVAFWIALAVFGALFTVVTPRLRAAMVKLATPPTDPATRAIGTAIGVQMDGVRITHELERIADGIETIAEAAKSMAKMEEQGTARMLESLADQLKRLDQKVDGR